MTLPDERYRSLQRAAEFLQRLASGEIPRVPRAVREQARSILRHYPTTWDLDQIESAAPHVLQQQMEPLHRMVAAWDPEVSQPHSGEDKGL